MFEQMEGQRKQLDDLAETLLENNQPLTNAEVVKLSQNFDRMVTTYMKELYEEEF